MSESPLTTIPTILRKNLKTVWMPALADYTRGKIGKLKLIQILSSDLTRMENELKITLDLMLKQRAAADLKPVWEDNLRTKAILATLLDTLEAKEPESTGQRSPIPQREEVPENVRSVPIASESKV